MSRPDPQAVAVGKRLVMFEGIQATFNRRRAAEQDYFLFHKERGARLRGKYRLPA